jgi:hypothetical protein
MASDLDHDPLTYQWSEGPDPLSVWADVVDGHCPLDLSTVSDLSVGDHTLTLEVTDGGFTSSDQMVLTVMPVGPIANAGVDLVVSNVVELDGSQSVDPDGTIELYQWALHHRENSNYDVTTESTNPIVTVSDLEPGFYEVTLTVRDDDDVTATDTMLLACSGPCAAWPQPNANLNLSSFAIGRHKPTGRTFTKMFGETDLPEFSFGSTVDSRITIELFGICPDGGDWVMSGEPTLKVRDGWKWFLITK